MKWEKAQIFSVADPCNVTLMFSASNSFSSTGWHFPHISQGGWVFILSTDKIMMFSRARSRRANFPKPLLYLRPKSLWLNQESDNLFQDLTLKSIPRAAFVDALSPDKDEMVASKGKNAQFNRILFETIMTKVYTLLITKTVKTHPVWGHVCLYSPFKGHSTPLPLGSMVR